MVLNNVPESAERASGCAGPAGLRAGGGGLWWPPESSGAGGGGLWWPQRTSEVGGGLWWPRRTSGAGGGGLWWPPGSCLRSWTEVTDHAVLGALWWQAVTRSGPGLQDGHRDQTYWVTTQNGT